MSESYFATASTGLATLLADELTALGCDDARAHRAGVAFQASVPVALRACLWSRVASRIVLRLGPPGDNTPTALYERAREILWREHLGADDTFAVDCTATGTPAVDPRFAALRVKDAIVDQFREATGRRPSVRRDRPNLRVQVHLDRETAAIGIDLAGESLSHRGYRLAGGDAPLRENVAAGLLLRAGWPATSRAGGVFEDPMCGSGTLVAEAALIAADVAPGLLRSWFGFHGWRGHDAAAWSRLVEEARERRAQGRAAIASVSGSDHDPGVLRLARDNLRRAGLEAVALEPRTLDDAAAAVRPDRGLLVTNPPYGERLGDHESLVPVYESLGACLRALPPGWEAAVLASDTRLVRHLGLRAHRSHPLRNGPIECRLFRFRGGTGKSTESVPPASRDPGAEMFANRLRKNFKVLGRWAGREGVGCYRLYDADMPEYAVAIDVYTADALHLHVQEYEAPRTVDATAAARRLRAALAVMPEVLGVAPGNIHFKRRRRQRHGEQYGKLGERGSFLEVSEGPCRLLVNLDDRIDTGLFLDHRPMRTLIGSLARNRDFLNLFAYTGAATVHAARGGARSTLSVDRSNTYVDWGRRNLELNALHSGAHRYLREECLGWLTREVAREDRARFGLINVDPPTFSNASGSAPDFDVQRDHARLLLDAAELLTEDGVLLFSTHLRRFRLDTAALGGLCVEPLGARTLPRDFARTRRVHQSFRITRRRLD